MLLTKRELPILVFNLIYVGIFTAVALGGSNHEFVLYAGVIVLLVALVVIKQQTLKFDPTILWGLSLWGLLHMAGGNLHVRGTVLYSLQLIPIIPSYEILRYDHAVHMFGFGVATLICHHLLRPYVKTDVERWRTLALLIVLMGSGVGALNEIIEFVAVVTVPETGVGGYENTMLDLVFNLLGGLMAVAWLTWHRRPA
ncbi:MAG: DUF2238 domain-containing protein [Phycisphaerales bacterium]|nr:MAG: DUF2238 domain-containing protein [Phycisphaerales bacterium]